MAPAQVQDIICKAQENHAANGKERADELHELKDREQGSDYRWPLPARACRTPRARQALPHRKERPRTDPPRSTAGRARG